MLLFILIFVVDANPNQGMRGRSANLAFPDLISHIIEIAEELKITDIYAQLVVGGNIYYDSRLLLRSQYLAKVSSSDHDRLDSPIKFSHQKSIMIYAWVDAILD